MKALAFHHLGPAPRTSWLGRPDFPTPQFSASDPPLMWMDTYKHPHGAPSRTVDGVSRETTSTDGSRLASTRGARSRPPLPADTLALTGPSTPPRATPSRDPERDSPQQTFHVKHRSAAAVRLTSWPLASTGTGGEPSNPAKLICAA